MHDIQLEEASNVEDGLGMYPMWYTAFVIMFTGRRFRIRP
jgi:hypothetical protein